MISSFHVLQTFLYNMTIQFPEFQCLLINNINSPLLPYFDFIRLDNRTDTRSYLVFPDISCMLRGVN